MNFIIPRPIRDVIEDPFRAKMKGTYKEDEWSFSLSKKTAHACVRITIAALEILVLNKLLGSVLAVSVLGSVISIPATMIFGGSYLLYSGIVNLVAAVASSSFLSMGFAFASMTSGWWILKNYDRIPIGICESTINQRLNHYYSGRAEIEAEYKLQQFYENNKVIQGDEPIKVDINTLGLNLLEEGSIVVDGGLLNLYQKVKQKVLLKQVVEETIVEINRLIATNCTNPNKKTLKEKRFVLLNKNTELFRQYDEIGLPSDKSICICSNQDFCLYRVIQALVNQSVLYSLVQVNGNGYYIQA